MCFGAANTRSRAYVDDTRSCSSQLRNELSDGGCGVRSRSFFNQPDNRAADHGCVGELGYCLYVFGCRHAEPESDGQLCKFANAFYERLRIARKLGLPRRLRTILEGEGLSNDATSLVLYEVAVAATMTGALSPAKAAGALSLAVVIGIGVGLIIAVAVRWLLTRLPSHPAGSGLVLVLPFAAYAAADVAHGSGVLAVVTVALGLSRYGDVESAQTRLVSGTTWEIVELLLTGAAFAFVGLEIRNVAGSLSGSLGVAIWQALAVTAVAIVIRFAWIFPVAALDERLRRRKGVEGEPVGWREMTVASWAGMRGVVTLAAVLALPAGQPAFPERDRLIFIAFVVIVVTMVVQGLTLPLVVKRLNVIASDDERRDATQDLIRRARDAGFRRLGELRSILADICHGLGIGPAPDATGRAGG